MHRFLFSIVIVALGLVGEVHAQTVLVCTLAKDQSVLKQESDGSLSVKLAKGDEQTIIFADLYSAKPVLKIGSEEFKLELVHADENTMWLSSPTPDIFGSGLAIWTIDRKNGIVMRSETFRLKDARDPAGGKLVSLSNIGRCH
jgi:hypothetical protein